jgi:hypothetical protein
MKQRAMFAAPVLVLTMLASGIPVGAQGKWVHINRRGSPIPRTTDGSVAIGATQQKGEPERLAEAALRRSVEALLQERQDKCVAAFPERTFCTCLNAALPVHLDFLRYVTLVSAASEQLAADQKAMQAIAIDARNRCAVVVR